MASAARGTSDVDPLTHAEDDEARAVPRSAPPPDLFASLVALGQETAPAPPAPAPPPGRSARRSARKSARKSGTGKPARKPAAGQPARDLAPGAPAPHGPA